MSNRARVIALYLPQFHPIPENDKWWGRGFTEWTNVGKARPLFRDHYQPHIPADLGYYDLRLPEAREAQAQMAREYGVEGFMYWHYWFGNGRRLLERPFNEVLRSGKPDFPFALAWANETWKGFAHGLKNRNILIRQKYYGDADYIAHFNAVLPAFRDPRYIRVEGKPIFMIYKPHLLPDAAHFIDLWQGLARQNGLPGIYFIAHHQSVNDHNKSEQESLDEMMGYGFSAMNYVRLSNILNTRSLASYVWDVARRELLQRPTVRSYERAMQYFSQPIDSDERVIPTLIPNWDHSPRSSHHAFVFHNSTPELFAQHIRCVLRKTAHKENQLIFVKSWNEWAEGNYLEPDLKWGRQYLEALKTELSNFENRVKYGPAAQSECNSASL